MTTATKSIAAGLSGPVVIIAKWLLTKIPNWDAMPMEVQGAFIAMVIIVIPALLVYHAPSNKQLVETPDA